MYYTNEWVFVLDAYALMCVSEREREGEKELERDWQRWTEIIHVLTLCSHCNASKVDINKVF